MLPIPLQGKIGEGKFALVDDEDYDYLMQFKWYYHLENGYVVGTTCYYENGKIRTRTIRMHRKVMKVTDSKIYVDHINHDKLDNRKENLRLCTNQENLRNSQKQKGKSSKYKGVFWNKRDKKWRAKITFSYETTYLGLYDSEKEAGLSYNAKAKELFGEFALLNNIEED